MKRDWVYDGPIKKALAYARKRKLDLGVEVVKVQVGDIESEPSVQPDDSMVESIRNAVARGIEWPVDMPLPVLACEPGRCMTLDGNHRLKAARRVGLTEVPAVVASLSTWDALLPIFEQEDVIPYDDFIAVLAEAGSKEIRLNLKLEGEARAKYGGGA